MSAPRHDGTRDPVSARTVRLRDPDPVPAEVTAAARAAFEATRPTETAVLVHDSLVDADEVAQKHLLRFEHPHIYLELHVATEQRSTRIEGVLDRNGPTRAVLILSGAGDEWVAPVEGTVFELDLPVHGLVRISLETDGGPSVQTDWFRV